MKTKIVVLLLLIIASALFNTGDIRAQGRSEMVAHQSNGRVIKIELGSKHGRSEDEIEVSLTNEFAPETPRIICRWHAEGIKAETVARGVWIAEDTNGAMEKETKLSESKMNVPVISNLTGIFILRSHSAWAVGKYRLDLYLGEELSKSIAFVIKEN